MNCYICNTPVSRESAIIIDNRSVCTNCKPSAIQRLRERGSILPEQINALPWKVCIPAHLIPFFLNLIALTVAVPVFASMHADFGAELPSIKMGA